MNIQCTRETHRTLVFLKGEIDELGAEEIKRHFRDISSSTTQEVEVDFSGVAHIGSAGIGKLLVFYKDLAMHGARLSLVRVPSPIYHLLREMKLDTLFTITELR